MQRIIYQTEEDRATEERVAKQLELSYAELHRVAIKQIAKKLDIEE